MEKTRYFARSKAFLLNLLDGLKLAFAKHFPQTYAHLPITGD